MGLLVDGIWHEQGDGRSTRTGRFERAATQFRNRIEVGSAFPPQPGRYHLYVSPACPWSHRTTIYRALKGLERDISLTIVDPLMLENGWTMAAGADPVNGARSIWQVYVKSDPHYSGRASVPVLWDRESATIVSNESADIIRMFDSWPAARGPRFHTPDIAAEIDALNERIYAGLNNGVYRAGFATTQAAYEEAYDQVFKTLDEMERRLADRRFLLGDRPTEADWRLFPTLVRFDAVYYGHFKCNRNRLSDMPELWDYVRCLYQVPGVAETVRMDHIKAHYYGSHRMINPTGIVPKGPEIDFMAPTRRPVPRLG